MIADLHCHYPMKLLGDDPAMTYKRDRHGVATSPRLDRLRARVFRKVAPEWNYPCGWRVDVRRPRAGSAGWSCRCS